MGTADAHCGGLRVGQGIRPGGSQDRVVGGVGKATVVSNSPTVWLR